MAETVPVWKKKVALLLLASCVILTAIKYRASWPSLSDILADSVGQSVDERKDALRFSFYSVLFKYGISISWIHGDSYAKRIRIPKDLPITEPYAALIARFRQLGGDLIQAQSNTAADEMTIEVGLEAEPVLKVRLVKDASIVRPTGKIAIVIDDFGHSYKSLVRDFLDLEQAITYSILPGLAYSEKIANAAFERDREVMLHMPMEPTTKKLTSDDFMLHAKLKPNEVRNRITRAIKSVPHARGINNHMGSLATENRALLSTIMTKIKRSGLFFLDSRTSNESIAFNLAMEQKIPCGVNSTFLDSIKEEPFIRKKVNLLAEIALREGTAIGIGHPDRLTLKVLREELPKLAKRGFQFVTVSSVIK